MGDVSSAAGVLLATTDKIPTLATVVAAITGTSRNPSDTCITKIP
jgi:hypothetical protein